MADKCKNISNIMDMYIDGMLSEKESADFLDHIAECESCRDEFNTLKYMLSLAKEIEDEDPPERLKENVMEHIKKSEFEKKDRNFFIKRRTIFRTVSTVAASIAVVFIVYALIGNGFMSSQKSDSDSALHESARSGEIQETNITEGVFEKAESDKSVGSEINEDSENETLAMTAKAPVLYDITISTSNIADVRKVIDPILGDVKPKFDYAVENSDEITFYVTEEQSKELLEKLREKYKDITVVIDDKIKEGLVRIKIE